MGKRLEKKGLKSLNDMRSLILQNKTENLKMLYKSFATIFKQLCGYPEPNPVNF